MKTVTLDGWSRRFGQDATRREFLHKIGAAAAIGIGAVALGEPAAARHKSKGKGKSKTKGKVKDTDTNATCRSWIISGGPAPTTLLSVDDDLHITVNGVDILNDANKAAGNLPAVPFAANVGDALAVVATDTNPACRSISPLWLHCATSGAKRQLSAGKNDGCAPGRTAGVFFTEVFTVEL